MLLYEKLHNQMICVHILGYYTQSGYGNSTKNPLCLAAYESKNGSGNKKRRKVICFCDNVLFLKT